MPRVDLQELSRRESEQTEWKADVADIDDVVTTLVALANDLQNLGGGYVVCGAREENGPDGFPVLVRTGLSASRFKAVEGTVLTRCRERVSPPITPLIEELPSDNPDRRILVFIQPATGHAHTCRKGTDGAKHYVRVSRTTIEARNGLLRDLLVRKGAMEPWDRRPCDRATVADLDLLALRDALTRLDVFAPDRGVESYLVPDVQMHALVPALCVAEPLTGAVRPRNFAVLLFGREPQKFIPGAFSLFSTYPGRDRSDPHAERHEIGGTVLDQARRLTALLAAQATTIFDKEDVANPNKVRYPIRALTEALGNTLAHRDYELYDPCGSQLSQTGSSSCHLDPCRLAWTPSRSAKGVPVRTGGTRFSHGSSTGLASPRPRGRVSRPCCVSCARKVARLRRSRRARSALAVRSARTRSPCGSRVSTRAGRSLIATPSGTLYCGPLSRRASAVSDAWNWLLCYRRLRTMKSRFCCGIFAA